MKGTKMKNAKANEWVQVTNVVLPKGERAPQVPEDTQNVDLRLWVKGFLEDDASIGDQVTIQTVTGREIEGELCATRPKYIHNYGDFVPELLRIQMQLKEIMKEVK